MKPLDISIRNTGDSELSIEDRMNALMSNGPTGLSMIGHLMNYTRSEFGDDCNAIAHFQHVSDPSVGFALPYRRAYLPATTDSLEDFMLCVPVESNLSTADLEAAIRAHVLELRDHPHLSGDLINVVIRGDTARVVAADHHPIYYGAITLRLVPPGSLPRLLKVRIYPSIFKVVTNRHPNKRQTT